MHQEQPPQQPRPGHCCLSVCDVCTHVPLCQQHECTACSCETTSLQSSLTQGVSGPALNFTAFDCLPATMSAHASPLPQPDETFSTHICPCPFAHTDMEVDPRATPRAYRAVLNLCECLATSLPSSSHAPSASILPQRHSHSRVQPGLAHNVLAGPPATDLQLTGCWE